MQEEDGRGRIPFETLPQKVAERRSQEAFVHVSAHIIEVGKKTENLI